MIIKCDAKQLEWRSYLELSRDAVGIQEIFENLDIHSRNQQELSLPSRLVAKVFIFRWIYRGPAYAYAYDPEFAAVSGDIGFWQGVIDRANLKYHVLYQYQNDVIARARMGSAIAIPSGREYLFEPKMDRRGVLAYDEKDISNWINQGFAADLMIAARRNVHEMINGQTNVLSINTVHDDVELDVANDPEVLYNISIGLEDAFANIPTKFHELFGEELVVPFAGEVSFGFNLKDLVKFDRSRGVDQFNAYADRDYQSRRAYAEKFCPW
jgi:hypothetical protein